MWQVVVVLGASVLVLLPTTTTFQTDNYIDHIPELPSLEQMVDLLGDYKLETLADLDAYSEAVKRLARLQISKAFSAEARRYKRALDTKSTNVTGLDLVPFNLAEQTDGSSWFNKVTGFEVLTHGGKTYLITGGPGNEKQAIMVISPPHYQLDVVAKFELKGISFEKMDIITAAVEAGLLWLAVGSSTSRLVTIVCINLTTFQVRYPQNIPIRGVLGALHMFQVGGATYLVIGERFHSSPYDTAGVSEIYMLMGRYFDRRDSFTLECNDVHSITGFTEGGTYMIILGMNNIKGTHVYQLDPMADTVTLVQELDESKVHEVIHYVDAHDLKHYVIILSHEKPASIYWWDNSQLVSWQVLETGVLSSSASSGFITLKNMETVIFIANGGVITVYTDDLTGHYYQTFSITTSCLSLSDIRGVYTDRSYFLYYICVGAVNKLERRVLIFREIDLVHTDETNTLLNCLNELNNTIEGRKPSIAYLKDIVDNDKLMVVDHDQVWTGPIVFTELTVTTTTTFKQTVNIVNIDRVNSTTSQSFAELEQDASRLENEITALQGELSNVLYYSGDQTITGPINASSLIIDNVDIDYLEINKFNGVKLTDFTSTFLIDGIDQTITGRWNVGYLSTDTLNTRLQTPPGRINGFLTSELMRQSVSNQLVTGNHSYSTVVAGEICNSLCNGFSVDINGIDTSTIVTQGSDVTFLDKKTFVNLKINGELNADLINGVDIRELSSRVIYRDVATLQTLDGQYTLNGVEVRGNVQAATINGVDLRQLDNSVVKTRGNYELAGGLVYNADLVVSGSLTTDTINGVLWSDVVDLDSSDLITGMYYFKDATILGSLTSNDINGLDISEDVVLSDRTQTINGRIQFTQSIEVTGPNGVLMEAGGTVNGVDPSELRFGPSNLGQIVITDDVIFTRPLEITGDVTVKSINGLLLEGIENRYWSLTKDQVINNSLHLENAVFQGPVTVATLNGRPLADYLHNYGNEIITGRYTFLGDVKVQGNLLMDPGRTVDGVDISELKENLVTLTGQQTITGQTTFQGKVTIIGDLDLAGKLNGIDVTKDLLRLDQNIPHTGHLTFASKTIINVLDIVGGDLTVQTLNGLDVAAAAADVVLADEDAVITGGGGLQFTGTVKVNELYVSGDVDGINLDDLKSRALLKNSDQPQIIDGRLFVDGDVQFDGGLTLNRVNGKTWSDHLNNVVPLDYSGFINGRKVFTQPIDINGDFNPSTINGIDIALLASRILRRTGEQTIDGIYTFNQDVVAKALFAPIIDGVDMAAILLIDVAGEVSGTVTFTEDVHLLSGLSSDHYVLDGCNVRELEETAVLMNDGLVDINGDVVVDKLIIRGSATSMGSILAGALNLHHFLDTLVLKSSDQIITAPMQFGDVTIDNLNVKTINNIDIEELFRLSVLMNEDPVINCDLRFTKGVRVGELVVRSSLSGRSGGGVLINGIDLSDIASRAVLSTGGTVLISGVKTFTNGFVVDDLVVAGSIGGVAVSSLVALSRTDILATGIKFTAPITVRGNLQVTGLVDGIDLLELLNNRITLNSTQTMFTSCTFENIRVEGDLEIGKINDVLLSDLVIRSASSQTITGKKVFLGGLQVNGNILVNTINGIDINELERSLVRKDVDTTINIEVTFNALVTSQVDILVNGLVNGFDLSELNAGALTDILIRQYTRIDAIRSQFGSITEENYRSAREMFAALSYLERLKYPRDTNITGSLWVGRIPEVGPGLYLKITSCPGPVGRPCGCNAECHYYKLNESAGLEPYVQLDYKVNILGHSLSTNLYVAIYSGCFEGVPGAQVRVVYSDGSAGFVQRVSLGLLSDSGLFLVDGISYIVTVSQFLDEEDSTETTTINVLMPELRSRTIAGVWSKSSTRSAVDLDLILIDYKWYLLVTNSYDASNYVDPYSAKSELYVWDKYGKAFTLKGEYIADHATSGMFISITTPVQEYFFSLTQHKSADYSTYEDNLDYTANVFIYRYNKASENFEPFQYLEVHGIMGQTILRVDDNYYLLLISAKYNSLYVFQYYHSEGFILYSTLRVKNPVSVAVLNVEQGTFVAVSTSDGLERFRVKTKGLDPDNLLLLKR